MPGMELAGDTPLLPEHIIIIIIIIIIYIIIIIIKNYHLSTCKIVVILRVDAGLLEAVRAVGLLQQPPDHLLLLLYGLQPDIIVGYINVYFLYNIL